MASHIGSGVPVQWISYGMSTQEKPLNPPINPTRYEKLLGFATPPPASEMENVLPPKHAQHHAYFEDDLTDLMEEDVWDVMVDDTSSVDDDENMTPSSKEWPDSETDSSHFSALFGDGAQSRVTGIFSPSSQFSPVIMSEREAMLGQIFNSSYTMSSEGGVSGESGRIPDIIGVASHHGVVLSNEIFAAGYGPRSASIEVPGGWSKLYSQMKNRRTFLGLDVSGGGGEDSGNDVSVQSVPPHVLLAKQNARSQVSAFSVIEGTGRTLKGRDVSKVRDAVWKQTGFSG